MQGTFQDCSLFKKQNKKKEVYIFSFSISLIRNCEKLPAQDHFIVQEYLDKPFLMEGYKFDLRIYILVTSCDPLRIFLYNDGLVRMGTEKYHTPNESNLVRMPYVTQMKRKQCFNIWPDISFRHGFIESYTF